MPSSSPDPDDVPRGVRLADQGHFWVGVNWASQDDRTVVDGTQLFVDYQIPELQTQPLPVVLVHGGAGQGLDWTATPDGRPGWRTLLVQQGYAVYTVDRPFHGRSPARSAASSSLPPAVEVLGPLFAGADDPGHTQWPGDGSVDDPSLGQLLASQTGLPDLTVDHELMARHGAELLDRIGRAIVITNSAGGPAGWLMADRRPDLVAAVVALEPMGPSGPFPLPWGLAAAPLTYDPQASSAGDLTWTGSVGSDDHRLLQGDPARTLAHLIDIPIAVVTSERSFAAPIDANTVAFLRQAGCSRVEHIRLGEWGVTGNGHLMMMERNNHQVLRVVTDWLSRTLMPGGEPGASSAATPSLGRSPAV